MKYHVLVLACCLLAARSMAQTPTGANNFTCGTDTLRARMLIDDPDLAEQDKIFEAEYRKAMTTPKKGAGSGVLTLPVVVHIVHNNGPENISDAQVLKGIEYLNDAFRNRNYYNPATGVDVEIEFCLAQRDMQGNAFSGITRTQSPLTDMSLKLGAPHTLLNWDTKNYINIILVREACLFGDCSGVAGFGTIPGKHGQPGDGIVMEAEYFGSNTIDGVVITHEMGHYLGLLHTFQGGCKNDDCLEDGDRVCDTPPDNSTGSFPCNAAINSCHTDADDPSSNNPYRSIALGGLGDQPDQYQNYMDYSRYECYDRFTEGQKQRMRFVVEGIRSPLLKSKACLPPCPAPVFPQFTTDKDSIEIGSTITINNQTQQAATYRWYFNGQLVSTEPNPNLTFDQEGTFVLRLEAESPLTECDAGIAEKIITVYCPVVAAFDYAVQGQQLIVSSTSLQADSLFWALKDGAGNTITTSTAPLDTLDLDSLPYVQLCLLVQNAHCSRQVCTYIKLIADGIEICDNGLDDDYDSLTDRFDPDCSCDSMYYQAVCPIDCEYVPDSFPVLSLKLKWVSEVLADSFSSFAPNITVGDLDQDGRIEVVSPKSVGNWTLNNVKNNTVILDGATGSKNLDFTFTNLSNFYSMSSIAIADVDNDGKAELFSILFNTILCYLPDGTLKWESEPLTDQYGRVINIADFNSDGIPELYVSNQILNAQTGKLLVSGNAGGGCNKPSMAIWPDCALKHTIAADLLPSPGLELAAGNTVYEVIINNPNGTVGNSMVPVMAPSPVTDGFTSIGDIDGDGQLDVVVVRDSDFPPANKGGIWVWNPRSKTIIASAKEGFTGGVAFIGNVQGDCKPEIGMTFEKELRMYEYDGSPQLKLLYKLPTTDGSGFTGITMFDFNQDGKNELIYRDETDLRILEGATGNTLASYPVKSPTGMEYPIIVDMDRDGHAEIVVNGYDSDSPPYNHRVYCFESAGAPWAPARSVWNQYGYHVTNVNDNLTIPREPQNPAAPLPGYETCLQPTCPSPYNTFLAQATYRTQQGCVQFPAVDLSLRVLDYECSPDSLIFHLAIQNLSTKSLEKDCIYISRYSATPQANAQALETICYPINPDTLLNDTIRLAWALPSGIDRIYFVVNDPGAGANAQNFPLTGLIECDYTNNTDSIKLDLALHTLDLGPDIVKCESAVVTFNAGAGFESYLWNDGSLDSIYSSGFAGLHFVEATDHCQRVYRDTVEVTIDPAAVIDLGPDTVVCAGTSLSFGLTGDFDFIQWLPASNVDCDSCMQINAAVDTSFLLMVVAGKENCYSTDSVQIQIKQTVTISQTASICAGDSLLFMGSMLTQPGQYVFPTVACDSTVVLDLIVDPLNHAMLNYCLCADDSVLVGGQWLSGAGTYNVQVGSASGCDTVFNVTISEILPAIQIDSVSLCAGDSIFLLGQLVNQAGIFSDTLVSAAGCDSTQTYVVFIKTLVQQTLNYGLCAGDSVLVGGQWLSGTGTYSVQAVSASGCDTVFRVAISEILPVIQTDSVSLCAGDSTFLFGQWVNQAGTFSDTFVSAAGCDSTQAYVVFVEPLAHQVLNYNLCAGDSISVGGQWLSGAGTYSIQASSISGCDTVFNVTISEILPMIKIDSVSLCAGDSIFLLGQWVNQAGTLSQTFVRAAGCDSTQTYVVFLEPLMHQVLNYNLCASDSILVGGQWLSGAGVYSIQAGSTNGCDTMFSVAILEILPMIQTDSVSLCAGDSIFLLGQWVNQAGTLSQTFASAVGCDSTQTYVVFVEPLVHQVLNYNLCAGDSISVGGQWLSGAGKYSVQAGNTSECDTIYDVTLTEIQAIVQMDSLVLCPGDSIWIHGNWINQSGTFATVYNALNGCDSIQTTVITALEMPQAPVAEIDCEHLEVLLQIQAGAAWAILWNNGDTLRQTIYKSVDTARVTLNAMPDCHLEFKLALPALPDTTQLPMLNDTSIYFGQSLLFDLALNPAEWQVHWSPATIFSCDTCLGTASRPEVNTTVEINFTHRSGCSYSSRFLISLQRESDFYVPNVFSPNSDGENDYWYFVPPNGVDRFEEVLIFDRWGNQLAAWKDIPEVAWDGMFRGKALDPAVFAYYIRFVALNGEKVEKMGDVTIMR